MDWAFLFYELAFFGAFMLPALVEFGLSRRRSVTNTFRAGPRALVVLGATTLHLPATIAPAVHDYRAGDSDWHRTVMGLALLGLLTDLVCAGAMLSVFARNCTAPPSVRALLVDAWTMLLGTALLLVDSMLMLGP